MSTYRDFSFTTQMTNMTTGAHYEPDSLSSGERILMALCLASFNQRLGRRRPRLLLLDELDAVLHPSKISALVSVVKSLFVNQQCCVLMSTHSPMTVAALTGVDVFQVVRDGLEVRLVATTTSAAVGELSEGIATVEEGLRIAASSQGEVTILTEGHNTRHIERWVELNFPGRVHVFDKLAEYTSKGQLLTYGRMLGAMNPTTHFIIVWDCDGAEEAQKLRQDLTENAKVTPFAFEQRDNKIARRGIENNYDEKFLSAFAITKSDSEGRELGHEFNKSRKREFAEHVKFRGTDEYFVHFEQLHKVVAGVLALQGRDIHRTGIRTS